MGTLYKHYMASQVRRPFMVMHCPAHYASFAVSQDKSGCSAHHDHIISAFAAEPSEVIDLKEVYPQCLMIRRLRLSAHCSIPRSRIQSSGCCEGRRVPDPAATTASAEGG